MENKVIINGVSSYLPAIKCTDFINDGEPHFKHRIRKHTLSHLVIHETAGRTAEGCKKTLLRKGYGVHLMIDPLGAVSCHGDLLLDVMSHAGRLNKTSIGIEVVNPYAPKLCGDSDTPYSYIPAPWWTWVPDKADRRYVLPRVAQIQTLLKLVPWLCNTLQIPYAFPTWHLNKKAPRIPRAWAKAVPLPGIVAHRDFEVNRSDGRFLLESLILDKNLSLTRR